MRFHLIVEAHNNGIMGQLPIQYGAITNTVRLFSFPITCTVFGAITSTVLMSPSPTKRTILTKILTDIQGTGVKYIKKIRKN